MADLIDFACAYLFIKLIYYALGEQVIGPGNVPGSGRAEMSQDLAVAHSLAGEARA